MNTEPEYTADDFPTIMHKPILEQGENAGCLSCLSVFPVSDITNWFSDFDDDDEDSLTATCPFCCQDLVVPEREGIKLDEAYLRAITVAMFAD